MALLIHRLSELVSNQIAAGEVVQRPSSVVKELMENAIDAGSESVSVSVMAGGKEEIQVFDEGCGIHYDDAVIAFERHATSKISQTDDLYNLHTFGFRGEALASVASVAEVEMRTCRPDDELGTVVKMRGGELITRDRAAMGKGTQMIVRNLFYNVPARRRSLEKKSENAEMESIKSEFRKVALCYPRHSFLLLSNKREVYNLPVANLRRRVSDIIGSRAAAELIDIYTDTEIVEIKGYIGKPEGAKKRPEQYMFVNNRYFRSAALHKAVMRAYENLLPGGGEMQPQYFLYFTVKPERLDVNIHPSKTEVHFDDESDIFGILVGALKAALGKSGIVPMIDFIPSGRIEIAGIADEVTEVAPKRSGGYAASAPNPFDANFSFSRAVGGGTVAEKPSADPYSSPISEFESYDHSLYYKEAPKAGTPAEEIESKAMRRELIVDELTINDVVRFGEKHILAVLPSRLLIINVRRAMGRIHYDRFSAMLSSGRRIAGQKLLFPAGVSLSVADHDLVAGALEELRGIGFELNEGERGSYTVLAVPADLDGDNVNAFFEVMLDALKSDSLVDLAAQRRDALLRSLVASIGASGYELKGRENMEHLVRELFASSDYSYAPNGKKIMAELSEADINNILS